MIASTPSAATLRANSTESAVQLSPALAMIGARPPTASMTAWNRSHLLVVEDRGRLAGGAADDERLAALVEQPERELLRRGQVELDVGRERRDHRGEKSAEARRRTCVIPLVPTGASARPGKWRPLPDVLCHSTLTPGRGASLARSGVPGVGVS